MKSRMLWPWSLAVASSVTVSPGRQVVEAGKKVYVTYKCEKCHRIGDVRQQGLSTRWCVASKMTAEVRSTPGSSHPTR